MIIHFPHCSLKVPSFAKSSFCVGAKELQELKLFLSDLYVDKLCRCPQKIKAKYNRLVLDVERFKDPEIEPMAKLGMGMVYTHSSSGKEISKPTSKHIRMAEKAYDRHHQLLDRLAQKELEKFGKCLIVDCHSFSEQMVNQIFGYTSFPDICIGVDEEFCDKKIVNHAITYFENLGYTVNLNYPYSGSLVPNAVYQSKDKRVCSLMIEINKKLYLSGYKKSKNFKTLKNQLSALLKQLNKEFYL